MSILNDEEIMDRCCQEDMIKPYETTSVKVAKKPGHDVPEKVISYGVSSYGYAIRIADEFKIFSNVNNSLIDPKDFSEDSYVDFKGDVCIIPPNSFVLCRSYEYMKIPRDVMVIVLGKSTYARTGLIVNVTPLEPGWEGHITMEISNTTPLPAKVYAHEGMAQLLFYKGNPCRVSYADRSGKYQGQRGVTMAKV